jgi:hypothetical protein
MKWHTLKEKVPDYYISIVVYSPQAEKTPIFTAVYVGKKIVEAVYGEPHGPETGENPLYHLSGSWDEFSFKDNFLWAEIEVPNL